MLRKLSGVTAAPNFARCSWRAGRRGTKRGSGRKFGANDRFHSEGGLNALVSATRTGSGGIVPAVTFHFSALFFGALSARKFCDFFLKLRWDGSCRPPGDFLGFPSKNSNRILKSSFTGKGGQKKVFGMKTIHRLRSLRANGGTIDLSAATRCYPPSLDSSAAASCDLSSSVKKHPTNGAKLDEIS